MAQKLLAGLKQIAKGKKRARSSSPPEEESEQEAEGSRKLPKRHHRAPNKLPKMLTVVDPDGEGGVVEEGQNLSVPLDVDARGPGRQDSPIEVNGSSVRCNNASYWPLSYCLTRMRMTTLRRGKKKKVAWMAKVAKDQTRNPTRTRSKSIPPQSRLSKKIRRRTSSCS